MARIEDLTVYFSTLRRGYDRGHFADRIKELGGLVETTPLPPEDFNTLFRIWLALEIPISSWSSLGVCLVPAGPVPGELLRRAVSWLMDGLGNDISPSRLGFMLNWLTAALDHNLASAQDMDVFYCFFQTFFQYERYATFVAKLLYTLTKPHDVTRAWTRTLLDLRKSDSPRRRAQIAVLLNLYKSYKPECVPESVPAVSVHNVFPKINATLLRRFKRVQNFRNTVDTSLHLSWRNKLREMGKFGREKYAPLVPDMEFMQFGSQLYSNSSSKTYLHFNDGAEVLAHAVRRRAARPAQLMSLLCNDTGAVILCLLPADQQSFFSHDLQHLLEACFLQEAPQHGPAERADLLRRLGRLQRLALQPLPVVSNFLAKYLVLWNGCDYLEEILCLCEWVQLGAWQELLTRVLAPLRLLHFTSPPAVRCRFLCTLTTLYANYAFTRTRTRNFFLKGTPDHDLEEILKGLENFISDLCVKSLQRYPDDAITLASCLWTYEALGRTQTVHAAPSCVVVPALAGGLALTSCSAHALHALARPLLLTRKVYARLRRRTGGAGGAGGAGLSAQESLLTRYRSDIGSCLWREKALSERAGGLFLSRLSVETAQYVVERFPHAERSFSLRRHLALAPYTYSQCDARAADVAAAAPAVWLPHLAPLFPALADLVERAVDR